MGKILADTFLLLSTSGNGCRLGSIFKLGKFFRACAITAVKMGCCHRAMVLHRKRDQRFFLQMENPLYLLET